MKFKLITLIILLSLLFAVPAQAQPVSPAFQDIDGSFAREAILELNSQGIISGINPSEFAPARSVTRRDFAVLLAKVLGIQPLIPVEPSFSDVPIDSSGAGYVEALARLGILAGEGEKRLGAEGPVMRQDAAVMLYRALIDKSDLTSLDGEYLDEGSISNYARTGVGYATHKGLMRGSDGCFFPLQELTRAEAAVLANQLLKLKKVKVLTPPKQVSSGKMELKAGETGNIGPAGARIPLDFTTVYGVDNPSIGTISADGTFTAGKQTEPATITVNSGLDSYSVKMSVSAQEDEQKGSVSSIKSISDKELAYGAICRVEQLAPDPGFQEMEYKNYSGPVDGLASQSNAWTGFLHQQGRVITIDLTKAQTITGVSLEFLRDPGSGINLPGYLSVEVSLDGKAWYNLGRINHSDAYTGTSTNSYNFTLTFQPLVTRYIKLSFPVDVWVFARHLSVKGGGTPAAPAVLALAGYTGNAIEGYMNIADIKNILLVYTGSHGADGTWNDKDFRPMVAYQDPEGGVGGSMFDTMLFIPYPDLPCTKNGWDAYLNDLFTRGAQLFALDDAVGQLNERSSSLKIKEKVILTLPYPEPTQKAFGELTADGGPVNFTGSGAKAAQSGQSRFAAVQWFYNAMMDRWKQAGFKNLELAGIYWYQESLEQTVAGEEALVQDVARLVCNDGHDFYWIPYYGSYGYENWTMYGFTRVLLQPNFYSPDSPPVERMDRAAELAGRYHLGIELECDDNILYSRYYYDLFYRQLNRAKQLGLERDITTAWYTGSKSLVKAGKSTIPQVRAIYDDIYRWINGNYTDPAGRH